MHAPCHHQKARLSPLHPSPTPTAQKVTAQLPAFLVIHVTHAQQRYIVMSGTACKHPDIRKFDGIRCCLACGEAVFETLASTAIEKNVNAIGCHVYTHLNYKLGQEVRLILLAPGEAADPLWCEIVHVNLEDDPEYDAVSYTWATEYGDADMSKHIDCIRGGYIPITTNCDAVLRQLRRLETCSTLR